MTSAEELKRRRHRNERIVAAIIVLVVALATVGVIVYQRRSESSLRRQFAYVPKHTDFTPELELLRTYIQFDTSNPPGNESPAAHWLADQLRKGGVQAELIESAPNRVSVYARVKGKKPGQGLLLLHHIDVWPADPAGWKQPPFSAKIDLNQLYGRGTIDMKGTGICFLRAFLDVATRREQPERDVVFLAVADEETGSQWGLLWLLQHRPDVVAGVKYALNEGGITEMIQERMTYYGIEIGTKQVVSVMLTADRREQLQKARIALEPWFDYGRPDRMGPEVKRFFRQVSPQRYAFREGLENVDRTVANGEFWRLPTGYRELTQDNVWAENVAARRDAGFEMRTLLINLPDTDPDKRLAWLDAKVRPFGVRVGAIIRKDGPVPIDRIDTPLFELLRRNAVEIYGEVTVGTELLNRSFNDSRYLRPRGIICYGINPFPIDFFQSETIHSVDERIRVDYFNQGVRFAREVVSEYASLPVTQSVRQAPQNASLSAPNRTPQSH
jgi:acetylornithine deacetylase/succinyl-diaminopimelate desuccinylase-like protein